MQQGLVQRTPRGRVLSVKGFSYLGITPSKNLKDEQQGDLL